MIYCSICENARLSAASAAHALRNNQTDAVSPLKFVPENWYREHPCTHVQKREGHV